MKDNFYEKLRDKLQQAPTYQPDAEMWQNIASKLPNPDRRFNMLPWLLAGLSILFSLLFYFVVNDYSTPSESHHIIHHTDTIYQSKEIIIRDTIYIQRAITENDITDYVLSQGFFDHSDGQTINTWHDLRKVYTDHIELNKRYNEVIAQKDQEMYSSSHLTNQDLTDKEQSSLSDQYNSLLLQQELSPLDKLITKAIKGSEIGFIPMYYVTKLNMKKNKSFGEILRPKTLTLRAHGGASVALNDKTATSTGYGYGLSAATLFSNRIRATLDYNRVSTSSYLEIENGDMPDVFPTVEAPEGSILHEIYFDHKIWSIGGGIDYLFSPSGRIRPYVGLQYAYASSQYVNMKYEFILDNEELYLSVSDVQQSKLKYLGLRTGLDINISKSIDGFIEVGYLHNLSGSDNKILRIAPGLQYHF